MGSRLVEVQRNGRQMLQTLNSLAQEAWGEEYQVVILKRETVTKLLDKRQGRETFDEIIERLIREHQTFPVQCPRCDAENGVLAKHLYASLAGMKHQCWRCAFEFPF